MSEQELSRQEGRSISQAAQPINAGDSQRCLPGNHLANDLGHQRSIKWANWIMVLIMALGAGIGWWTANIYQRQLEVQNFNELTKQDQAMLNKAREKQHLEAFFVEIAKEADPLLRADRRIAIITAQNYQTRPWADVSDLFCLLYEENGFYNPTKVRLREAFALAEDLLYLLNNVFNAHESRLLDDADYLTWIAYLSEVGDHPLFLAAIYSWHGANYLGEEMAAELQKWLCRPGTHTRATIDAIFSEMKEKSWPRTVGQKKTGCALAKSISNSKPPTNTRLREAAVGEISFNQ